MTFRFVPSLSDTDLQTLMATYTYGVKLALRRRAHAIVLSHQGHTIDGDFQPSCPNGCA